MTTKKIKVIIHKTTNSRIQENEILLVSFGYARNYLIPKNIASIATHSMLKKLYKRKNVQKQKIIIIENQLTIIKALLENLNKFSIKKQVSRDYQFFGSLIRLDIMQLVFKATNTIINKKQIRLLQMRKVGLYTVEIQLSATLIANIKLQVLPIFI